MYWLIYILIGCFNFILLLRNRIKKQIFTSTKNSVYKKVLFIFKAIFIFIILWPAFIIYSYINYRHFRLILKGRINPFWEFYYKGNVNGNSNKKPFISTAKISVDLENEDSYSGLDFEGYERWKASRDNK